MQLFTCLGLTLITSVALCTAEDRVVAPHMGTVLGADGRLRYIRGVPGAAYAEMGPDAPYVTLTAASHAAVVVTVQPKSVRIVSATGSSSLPGAAASAVAISPRGKFVAIIAAGELRIYDSTSLEVHYRGAVEQFHLSPGDPTALAVSDTGAFVVGSHDASVYVDVAGRISYAAFPLVHPRFPPDSAAHLVAYSPVDSGLVLLRVPSFAVEILASERDGLEPPTGLEFARDSHELWISQTGPVSLLSYSFETHSLTQHRLAAGHLRPIGNPGIFLWTPDSVLDTTRPIPTVLLIPDRAKEDQ